jgi:hypothetical protein
MLIEFSRASSRDGQGHALATNFTEPAYSYTLEMLKHDATVLIIG